MLWLVVVGACLLERGCLAALPLRLLVALPSEEAPRLAKGLQKGEMNVTVLPMPGDIVRLTDLACDTLGRLDPHLLISLLPHRRNFYLAMVAGQAGLPLLSVTRGYADAAAQMTNRLLVTPDPPPEALSDALFRLLSSQDWLRRPCLLLDGSQFATRVADRTQALLGSAAGLRKVELVPGNRSRHLVALSRLQASRHRVVAVCCSRSADLLRTADQLGMLDGGWVWVLMEGATEGDSHPGHPGVLGLRLKRTQLNRNSVRSALDLVSESVKYLEGSSPLLLDEGDEEGSSPGCWGNDTDPRMEARRRRLSEALHTVIRRQMERESSVSREGLEPASFEILGPGKRWRRLGEITGPRVALDAWLRTPGHPSQGGPRFRVVTALSPPFVREGTRLGNGSCLIGVPCLRLDTSDKHEIVRAFAHYRRGKSEGVLYSVSCCAGISISLLAALSRDLRFRFDLYMVADGLFGAKRQRDGRWSGVTGDLVSGAAHMAFSAYSVTSARQRDVDFSVPYFHSGISCLTSSQYRVVPLSAFLVPFSTELWAAIFVGLTCTACAAAVYEWFSPFGLNPWGRQRTKNFSLASALWVMWSLLFSHLVAFKAPKSWPNKVLINVWGCFSVIFLASYTANIAALFAGLFFHLRVENLHDAKFLGQKTGTTRASAAEFYVQKETPELWQHIQRYGVDTMEQGLQKLRSKELDVLIGDTAILNYFRGNDPGCNLHLLGESIFDDAYAVGTTKGFPFTPAISEMLLRYAEFGYVDQLAKKWYGRVPCFDDRLHRFNQPEPLSVGAVAGPFLLLLAGMGVGLGILAVEHATFRYALPVLRSKPRECFWKSPNLMFFSQKLYRFINVVDLVSPHHSIKEIVANLREGQIASLFQKSVKKKFKEEARRRRSKSQFFDMIQEMRKIVRQQNEAKPPSWEDSRQRLTLSPPQWTEREEDGEEDEEEDDEAEDEDESTMQLRNYLSSLRDSNKVSVLLKTCQYQGDVADDDDPESLVGSSLSSDPPAPRGHLAPRLSASTGDLASTPPRYSPDAALLSRSADDLREAGEEAEGEESRLASRSESLRSSSLGLDRLRLLSLPKEEIVRLWQSSERALLNRLQDALREKRLLEQKLGFVQRTLVASRRRNRL